jgi:hypothetical protein
VPEARDGPGAERERVYGLRATVRFPNGWELIELIHGVTPSGEITELLAAVFTRRQIPPDYAREFVGELL